MVGEGAGDMLQSRCSDCAPKQADSCGISGLDMTRVTSRSEELRLQGDQPHRGLRSAVEGNPGDQPQRGLPSFAAWGDQESRRPFSEELEERMSSVSVRP